jgi:phage terminase large subunit-like protein
VELADQQKRALNTNARYLYVKAGNQSGKSELGAFKAACEALQRFPDGYTGYRAKKHGKLNRAFDRVIWCLAPNNLMVRDTAQQRLLGNVGAGATGQGLIPADRILDLQMARGVAGSVDTAIIRDDMGGSSAIQFRSYEMSRDALQGQPVDHIWLDEMLTDMPMFNEFLARGTATSGSIWLTATPRKQQSPVALWWREEGHAERQTVRMSTRETTHLSVEQVASMEAAYSPIERKTRIEGEDFAGGGLVLFAPKDDVGMDRPLSSFPNWMRKIIGFDPSHGGLSESAHPAGVVFCLWDPTVKIFYVVDAFRERHLLPEQLAARIKQTPWADAPVAWGHGERQGTSTGESYAAMYKRLGLRMLGTHATLPGGGYSLDVSFDIIQQEVSNGRLKINRHLHDLWDELGGLERDDNGKIIAIRDDILSALRYAHMMRNYARETLGPYDRVSSEELNRRLNSKQSSHRGDDFDLFMT